MSEHAVPDWVHPGAQVAVCRYTGPGYPVTLTTVKRLTATQIVLATDELLAALGKAAELVEATRARVVELKGADS